MHKVVGRDVEQRLVAENGALHDDGRDRGDHRGAEQRRVQVANDLLERKDHRGDRRVKGRRQGARRTDGNELFDPLRRQVQPSADDRRDARPDLGGRTFPPHRVSGPDAQHAGQEFPNRHTSRNVAVVKVKGGLGLWHAAAPHARKHANQQDARDQADQRWHRRTSAYATGRYRRTSGSPHRSRGRTAPLTAPRGHRPGSTAQ